MVIRSVQAGVLSGMLIMSAAQTPVHAQSAQAESDADWPCAQILVPHVPAAVVWAGPSVEGMQLLWDKDPEIKRLVKRLTARDYDMEKADAEIGQFAAAQDASKKDHRLTLLFAGVLQNLNEARSKEHEGIMSYSRGQAVRAESLSRDLDEMVRLEEETSPAARERLALMQKEMALKQRMFDEREGFIQYLCSRPVLLEQKLGQLARTIAYYLD